MVVSSIVFNFFNFIIKRRDYDASNHMDFTYYRFYHFSTLYRGGIIMQTDFYKVVTFINPAEDEHIFGTAYFETYEEAEFFAESFESLKGSCVAIVKEIKID